MENMADRKFSDYDSFFLFYLTQHSNARNRALHAVGTISGIAVVIAAVALRHPWYALLWPVIAYGCAWTGHFAVEGNKPATFGHPLWSFISDFRMVWLMLTGQLDARMSAARAYSAASR
jgi:hypothetical protein